MEFEETADHSLRLASINGHEDGRSVQVYDQAVGGGIATRVEYYHKDHLGNVRLSFSDLNQDGALTVRSIYDPTNEILLEKNYYPFGLELTGPWFATVAPDNVYRYNGKELDEATGLYDYGARYYDSAIARWGQVDPLAKKRVWVTAYNYVQNNPLIRFDPDGLTDYTINRKGKIEKVEGSDTDDGPDRLVRGQASYNKKGKLKGKYIEVEKGTFDNIDTDGENYQILITATGESTEELYDFIAGSTNNEMGKYDVVRGDGTKESIFHTTFDWDKIEGNSNYLKGLKEKDPGLELISMIHSHGNDPNSSSTNSVGTLSPSGTKPGSTGGDVPQLRFLNRRVFSDQGEQPKYYIWRYGNRAQYNENGKIKK